MTYTKEQIKMAMACKSAGELRARAAASGVQLSDDMAGVLYSRIATAGELSDDALDGVAGGACDNSNLVCPHCGSSSIVPIISESRFDCMRCGKSFNTPAIKRLG